MPLPVKLSSHWIRDNRRYFASVVHPPSGYQTGQLGDRHLLTFWLLAVEWDTYSPSGLWRLSETLTHLLASGGWVRHLLTLRPLAVEPCSSDGWCAGHSRSRGRRMESSKVTEGVSLLHSIDTSCWEGCSCGAAQLPAQYQPCWRGGKCQRVRTRGYIGYYVVQSYFTGRSKKRIPIFNKYNS